MERSTSPRVVCVPATGDGRHAGGGTTGVERRGRRPELGAVDVQADQILRPGDRGQGARSILRHGAVHVLQLHDDRLLERPNCRRVSST